MLSLHQREVIEAAKKFVCIIRLTAYEDESERLFQGFAENGA
jgi:hypothetical protein